MNGKLTTTVTAAAAPSTMGVAEATMAKLTPTATNILLMKKNCIANEFIFRRWSLFVYVVEDVCYERVEVCWSSKLCWSSKCVDCQSVLIVDVFCCGMEEREKKQTKITIFKYFSCYEWIQASKLSE